jgi:hypothetical protein
MNMHILLSVIFFSAVSCSAMQEAIAAQESTTSWSRLTVPISKIISMCKRHPIIAMVGAGFTVLVVAYTTCEQFRHYVDAMVGLRPAEDEFKQLEYVFDPEEFLKILQEREKAGNPVFIFPVEEPPVEVMQGTVDMSHPA